MQTITTIALETVSGGASKSSEITTALNGVTSALSSAKNNQSTGTDPTMMMMMGLMMSQKSSGPTVVQAGAPAAPAVVGGPIVNISTRVRRGW